MNKKLLVWLAVALVAVAVGALALRPAGGIENVDAKGAQAAIDRGAQVIDVRTSVEYEGGHLPKAINAPVDSLSTAAQGWDRNATYLVYCATGARSAQAVETMKAMGFSNIKHFNSGMQAWSGQVERGTVSTGGAIQTSGKPVLIEFFTDS